MKPVDVKSNTCINSSKEINDKDPKFKIDHIVGISEYKNIFAKDYVPNWSEEILLLQKLKKILFRGRMLLVILKLNKLLERFMKNNCKKQIKKSLQFKK